MAKLPVEIAIIGRKYLVEIERSIEIANNAQTEFEFSRIDQDIEGDLRLRAPLNLDYDEFVPEMEQIITKAKGYHPFVTAIVDCNLSGSGWSNLFSGSFPEKGIGIYTTKDVEGVILDKQNISAYILYYFARFAVDFCVPGHDSHRSTESCIYDFKEMKKDIIKSMKADALCDGCRKALASDASKITYKQLAAADRLFEITANLRNSAQPIAEARKPRVFVGSSTEALDIARKIQQELDHDCLIEIWNQGTVFGLGDATIEALESAVESYDFAIFVLTPDDEINRRGKLLRAPRDNVIFEVGLFAGKLTRRKAFIVHPRLQKPDLPSDLNGLTTATYDESAKNLAASLGPACEKIREAIRRAAVAS
jgi:predicted nucleotide-binding protein